MRNTLFGGHKLVVFVWLVLSYVFLEIFNADVGGVFWFNTNMQNSALWLTLALRSQDTGRLTQTTFGHKCLVAPLWGAIRGHISIWSKISYISFKLQPRPFWSIYVALSYILWNRQDLLSKIQCRWYSCNKIVYYEIRMLTYITTMTLYSRDTSNDFLFDISVPHVNVHKSHPRFQGVAGNTFGRIMV